MPHFDITYILTPLIGCAIGYITNDVAIRMLFRPHQKKYICGLHVPFTPGIIPKERGRIAAAVGASISENLMNREVLEKNLLSEQMISRLRDHIDRFIDQQRDNHETLAEWLCHYATPEDLALVKDDVSARLSEQIHHHLQNAEMGNKISHIAVQTAISKMTGGLLGFIHNALHADRLTNLIAEPAEKLLAKHINEMIRDNSEALMGNMISEEIEKFVSQPVCQLLEGREERLAHARESIIDLYRTTISERLPRILDAIDITHIIETRINEMDMNEAEQIIHQVMDKELKAVIWFGAGLGLIIATLGLLL